MLSSSADNILYPLDERIVIKPAINEFQEDGVIYKDGSAEDFDVVIFCTGYKFSFPFLSDECDVKLEDNYIRSLYKHIVNIHHPTMGFIGITYLSFVFPMVDIQVDYESIIEINNFDFVTILEQILSGIVET